MATSNRRVRRIARHARVRKKVSGSAARPRLAVCCTLKHFHVQVVDDEQGHTLVAASTLDKELRGLQAKGNVKGAQLVGKVVAERAIAKGIRQVVFDRGGFKYHGRVKALADAARAAGLAF